MTGQFITLGTKYNEKQFETLPFIVLKENESGVVVFDILNENNEFVNSVVLEHELKSVDIVIEIAAYQVGITKSTLKSWKKHEFTSGSPTSTGLLRVTLEDKSVIITVANAYFADKMFSIVESNKKKKKHTQDNNFESTDSGDIPAYARRR